MSQPRTHAADLHLIWAVLPYHSMLADSLTRLVFPLYNVLLKGAQGRQTLEVSRIKILTKITKLLRRGEGGES
jgi:hypothetical protein